MNFNSSIKTGETWNGRIGFRAENFARKVDRDYSIEIPIDMPQAIISGKTAGDRDYSGRRSQGPGIPAKRN